MTDDIEATDITCTARSNLETQGLLNALVDGA